MPIQFQSPIAAAHRKEKFMREQMAADFQMQAMRGEQDRVAAEQRNKQQMQRAALQHFLGQAQQFGGMDETIARQKNIMGEMRAQAGERRTEELHPVKKRELESLTRQKETLENMLSLKSAVAAGQDLSKVTLVGPAISPERRARMAAEAKRMSNEKAQLQLDNLNNQIRLMGTKAYRTGKKGVPAVGKMRVLETTIKGARERGATYEMEGKKAKSPTGKTTSRVKGALPKPVNRWHIYHPNTKRVATVNSLKQNATGTEVQQIDISQEVMQKAYKVSIMKPGKKKDAALADFKASHTYSPFRVYHTEKRLKLGILRKIAIRTHGAEGWQERGKARVATGKVTERAAATVQMDRDEAHNRSNGFALMKMGLKDGMMPVGNKVADGRLKIRARKLADKKLGIGKLATAKYKKALAAYQGLPAEQRRLRDAAGQNPVENQDMLLSKFRNAARETRADWDDAFSDEFTKLLDTFQFYRNARRKKLLKEAQLVE